MSAAPAHLARVHVRSGALKRVLLRACECCIGILMLLRWAGGRLLMVVAAGTGKGHCTPLQVVAAARRAGATSTR